MTAQSDTAAVAAAWLIRLEAQTTPQLWDDFNAWIEADRRNQAAFVRLRTAWTHCDRFKLLRPADGRVDRDLLAHYPTSEHGLAEYEVPDPTGAHEGAPLNMDRRRWLVAAAAAGTLAAGPGLFAWLTTRSHRWIDYETGVGDSRRALLPDRSSVFLNTDTRVRVRLGSTRRDSELLRGEALFTIAQDMLRPFYVKAAGSLVCAMKTSFSIHIRDENRTVEVLVTDGRVTITPAEAPSGKPAVAGDGTPYASAGDRIVLGPGSWVIQHETPDYIARKLAWKSGRISFDGETLAEAVHELNRYNRRHLAIADPAIAQLRVGGMFDATDPESFAATLEKHFGVQRMPAGRGDDEVIRLVSSSQRMAPRP
jgi:transmembrane sensor